MDRRTQRVLDDIETLLSAHVEAENGPVHLVREAAQDLTQEFARVRSRLTYLEGREQERLRRRGQEQQQPQLPRSIYIVGGHEDRNVEGVQDADLVLVLENTGYQHGLWDQLMQTDATVFKNRNGIKGGTITIIENWPS